MSKRTIVQPQSPKDGQGAYLPLEPSPPRVQEEVDPNLSIDSLLQRSLLTINRMLKHITIQSTDGTWDRESVQNLKDLTMMLLEFKKKEAEILDQMSDDQLEAMVKHD